MTLKERYGKVLRFFETNNPAADTELDYRDPYELIVAVVLSAQCTDKRVNIITPPFFRRFPDIGKLAAAKPEEVYELIKSCSYPNNKTKHLIGMARKLVEDFGGQVPSRTEELQRLPGVGRKTANVIASVAFRQPALAVDTHVHRVAGRIGLTRNSRNVLQTEKQLVRHIPRDKLSVAHHWLILHGRYICQARKPKCGICGIREFCRYFEKELEKTTS